jgi:hypothetical protein
MIQGKLLGPMQLGLQENDLLKLEVGLPISFMN